jgi:hypothetical protein
MKPLASVCCIVVALAIVGMAASQEDGKTDNKDMECLQGTWRRQRTVGPLFLIPPKRSPNGTPFA